MNEKHELLINAWLDGELSPDEEKEFLALMQESEEFSQQARSMKDAQQLLQSSRPEGPEPEVFLASIQRRIRRNTRERFYRVHRFRFPLEYLSLILVIAVLLFAAHGLLFPTLEEQIITKKIVLQIQSKLPAELLMHLGAEEYQDSQGQQWVRFRVFAEKLGAAREQILPFLRNVDSWPEPDGIHKQYIFFIAR